MNAITKINSGNIDWPGCHHWSFDLPYRAIVPVKIHAGNSTILYQIAGSPLAPRGAENALREAMQIHGGYCFYCEKKLPKNDKNKWTLDHVEASALGGKSHLANLVIACKLCNLKKGHQPIDSFNPNASRKWLSQLQEQVEGRLKRLG